MATHYDILGVDPSATPAQIREAYHERARQLHPDRHAGRTPSDAAAARRAMQDVNEAWRILREPASRAAYDDALRAAAPAAGGSGTTDDDGWFDRPYPHPAADPHDLSIAIVRAVPWLAVLVVLAAIFFFTAYARTDPTGESELIGRCVRIEGTRVDTVACTERNDGRVVGVVGRGEPCTPGATTRAVDGGDWLCLQPAAAP